MEKSKLNLLKNDFLRREQLKTVFGGYLEPAKCIPECITNSDCGYPAVDNGCFTIQFPDGCQTTRCVRNFT